MGERTCGAIVGFVAFHVSVVLSIISISTEEWIRGEYSNSTARINTTAESCDQGFWQLCCGDDCQRLEKDHQSTILRVTTGLMMAGVVLMIFGTLLMYAYLCGDKIRTVKACGIFLALIHCLAAGAEVTAIILFGVEYKKASALPDDYTPAIGWSYWVAVAGTIVGDLAIICTARILCFEANREVGYVNI